MKPIERAGEAIRADNCPCERVCYCSDWEREAELAFSSIDEDELANWWDTFDGPAHPSGELVASELKKYLLGEGSHVDLS